MAGAAAMPPTAQVEMQRIQEAFEKWDALALLHSRKQKRFGFFTALLGPVAVLLLTVQILAFPRGGLIGVTLIAAELASLMIALAFGFFNIGSPDRWMRDRLRAEVLRRERFLVLARVGPYLTEADPANAIKRRLVIIDNESIDPAGLVSMQDAGGRTWRGLLEDARAHSLETASPDPDAFEGFYNERLLNQKNWYSAKGVHWGRRDELFENAGKGVLVAALVVAAWHLATLHFGAQGNDGGRSASQLVTEVLAIVLPPVGAAAIALQSLFEGRRLSRAYGSRVLTLTGIEEALVKLQPQFASSGPKREEHEFQFKRLVLRTEEALASELLQWWLLRRS